jgi:hypothetical protein
MEKDESGGIEEKSIKESDSYLKIINNDIISPKRTKH